MGGWKSSHFFWDGRFAGGELLNFRGVFLFLFSHCAFSTRTTIALEFDHPLLKRKLPKDFDMPLCLKEENIQSNQQRGWFGSQAVWGPGGVKSRKSDL